MSVNVSINVTDVVKGLQQMAKDAKNYHTFLLRSGRTFAKVASGVSKKYAPTEDTIRSVAAKVGNRLKIKRGRTREREILSRIKNCGLLSRRWRYWKMDKTARGYVVWIIDNVKYSQKVDEKQNHTGQALVKMQGISSGKLRKYSKQVVERFHRKSRT